MTKTPKNNNYSVYKHTAPNGKVYIGITCQTLTKRWKNGQGYDGCTAFYRAIQKYGWDNIEHVVVASGLDKAEACKMEQEIISRFDSTNPNKGYNLTKGGEHYEVPDAQRERYRQTHLKYYEEHPEARERISQMQKGKKNSPETIEKKRETMRAYIASHPEARERCRNNFKGKKRSKENCEKIGAAHSVSVICLDTMQQFNSVKAAAEWAGVCPSAVSAVLRGYAKTTGGYRFDYYKGGQ